ncbi:rod shape-determining protein RodA [Dolosigranulum pigrum]|nr:FtsW/RodA/SpoVE family cell cycle protein [Dolosigranulum pigrum]QJS97349.1 rod shape-determining protein RodA [Dolosigranulum pigrum]
MMEQQSPQRIDYGIIFPVLTLCIIGIVFLYSTTVVIQGESMAMTLRQLIWYGVGISLAALMLLFDSKLLWRMTPYVYWGSIALLIGAIFIYDRDLAAVAGARRWVTIPGINMTFQVTEFVKIPFILQLSRIVTKHNSDFSKRNNLSDFRLLGKIALYTVIPLLLILNQPDLGTALVFVAVAVSITLMSGIRWRILVPLFGVTLLVAVLFVIMVMYNRDFLQNVLGFHEYQFRRIDTWLNPTLDTSSSSYQITQTFKAIGSGGLFGKGFGVSEVYVPVRESDMIMSTIAENFGFVGASAVIFTYFLLVYNMIKVVYDTRNEFYAYIATGVITMIVFHVFENIGMNIGLLPLTGIPLPFISQGGSALIGNMMGVGLLMSMRFNHQSYFYSGSLRGRR